MSVTIKITSDNVIDPKKLNELLPVMMEYIQTSIQESIEGDEKGLPSADNTWSWDIYDEDEFLFNLAMTSDENLSEEISDLFEDVESLPTELQELLASYVEEGDLYEQCAELLTKVEALGYTFEYGLDGIPFGLKKLN